MVVVSKLVVEVEIRFEVVEDIGEVIEIVVVVVFNGRVVVVWIFVVVNVVFARVVKVVVEEVVEEVVVVALNINKNF